LAEDLRRRALVRDYRKLRTFALADSLVSSIYRETREFPPEERYGLRAQIRRAAVSVPTNIVEGSARRTTREYLHFLRVAFGSSVEAGYLVRLALALELMNADSAERLAFRYDELAKQLLAQMHALTGEKNSPSTPQVPYPCVADAKSKRRPAVPPKPKA
jgi:four helix bundle protein